MNTKLLTATEFLAQHEDDGHELVRGKLRKHPMMFLRHGMVCATIGAKICHHADTNRLGQTMSNNSFMQTEFNPDTIRGPDICFFSYDRLPPGPIPEGLLSVNPDLVVEVLSLEDVWTVMFAKVEEYLRAGVRVVLVLDPETLTASVYRSPGLHQTLQASETLTIPEILPGFSVPVGKLFE